MYHPVVTSNLYTIVFKGYYWSSSLSERLAMDATRPTTLEQEIKLARAKAVLIQSKVSQEVYTNNKVLIGTEGLKFWLFHKKRDFPVGVTWEYEHPIYVRRWTPVYQHFGYHHWDCSKEPWPLAHKLRRPKYRRDNPYSSPSASKSLQ